MNFAPELAKEIILALLIEERKDDFLFGGKFKLPFIEDKIGLINNQHFSPSFYTRGPFLRFLKINPSVAIETISQLIDFATDRWIEEKYKQNQEEYSLELLNLKSVKRFYGDINVYHWYHGFSGPEIISSALMAIEKWLYDQFDKGESINKWIRYILRKSHSLALIGMLSEVGRYIPEAFKKVLKPLLLIPDLFFFENVFSVQGGYDFRTILMFNEGEWLWEKAREWDEMKHRQIKLIDIASSFFLNDISFRKEIISVKGEWIKAKNVNIGFVKQLLELFDLNNWKEVKTIDGTEYKYEPQILPNENFKQIEYSKKLNILINRSSECLNRINYNNPLENDQIFIFVKDAKDIVNFVPIEKELKYYRPENVILGTFALIAHFHRDWLKRNPLEEKWFLKEFHKCLGNNYGWAKNRPEEFIYRIWEDFVSEIASIYWIENTIDKKWRKIITKIAVYSYQYSALEILVRRAFDNRKALGDSFWQLINIIITKSNVDLESQLQSSGDPKKVLTRWYESTCEQFANNEYSANPYTNWGELSIKNKIVWPLMDNDFHKSKNRKFFFYKPQFDVFILQKCFNNVFLPNQGFDLEERLQFFHFWEQVLFISLIRTIPINLDGKEIDIEEIEVDLPSNFDYWLLDKISLVVSQMLIEEQPERFFSKILDLGPRGEVWVERFFSNWFLKVKQDSKRDDFIDRWKKILDYCLSSKIWTQPKQTFRYRTSSLWASSIGLSKSGPQWTEKDAEIITSLEVYLHKIIPNFFQSMKEMSRLFPWLCRPETSQIRFKMLEILSPLKDTDFDFLWDDKRLLQGLSQYLSVLWDEHRDLIISNITKRREFQQLLNIPANRNEILALELQSRISSRN
jgi:hypothetical protein